MKKKQYNLGDNAYGYICNSLNEYREYLMTNWNLHLTKDTEKHLSNHYYCQHMGSTADKNNQYCFGYHNYNSDWKAETGSLGIGILYPTTYHSDRFLINKNNRWYGLYTYGFSKIFIFCGASYTKYDIYYFGYYGYTDATITSFNDNTISDLEVSLRDGTFEIAFITNDMVFGSSVSNPHTNQTYINEFNAIIQLNYSPLTTTFNFRELEDPDYVDLIYTMSLSTQNGRMRKIWIKYCNEKREYFHDMALEMYNWLIALPERTTKDTIYIDHEYFKPISECLDYLPYKYYYQYNESSGDVIMNCNRNYVKSGDTIYYSGKTYYYYWYVGNSIEYNCLLLKKIFPKTSIPSTNTDRFSDEQLESINLLTKGLIPFYRTGEDDLQFFNIYRSARGYLGSYIYGYESVPYFYSRIPWIYEIRNDGIYYPKYTGFSLDQITLFKSLTEEVFFDIHYRSIEAVVAKANKYGDSDELVMFGPELKCGIYFDWHGYNITLHPVSEEEGNVVISFDFITDESDQWYMRTTGWNFMLKDTDQILPWWYVRSSDYTEIIEEMNEGRETTTSYRRTEQSNPGTIWFKDPINGMTGAIESSSLLYNTFYDLQWLQQEDLDGMGEICSSILAVEKDFYESLNENSESTTDFKRYNTYYIELLESQVDELHLLITEQGEMTNDVKTKFSEVLNLIHTFYTDELPLPKEPVTPEDILESQIDIFDKKNILSIFN